MMLALPRSEEALVFENNEGRYAAALQAKGYPIERACARDWPGGPARSCPLLAAAHRLSAPRPLGPSPPYTLKTNGTSVCGEPRGPQGL